MLGMALPSDSVEVTVDSESDDRGILGVGEDIPAGALSVRIVVSLLGGSIDREAFEDAVRWAVDHCPVTDTARRAVPLEVVFG